MFLLVSCTFTNTNRADNERVLTNDVLHEEPEYLSKLYFDNKVIVTSEYIYFTNIESRVLLENNNILSVYDLETKEEWSNLNPRARRYKPEILTEFNADLPPTGISSIWNINEKAEPIVDENGNISYFNLFNGQFLFSTDFDIKQEEYLKTYPIFYKGFTIGKSGNKAYMIDETGKKLKTFKNVEDVEMNGVIKFSSDTKGRPSPYVHYDAENVPEEYISIQCYILTYQDGMKSLVTYDGNEIFEFTENDNYNNFSMLENGNFIAEQRIENLGDETEEEEREYTYKFYNSSGNQIGKEYKNVWYTTTNKILVQRFDDKLIFVDMHNNQLFGKEFIEAHPFYDDVALVKEDANSGYRYIDASGNYIGNEKYYKAKQFYNGIGIVGNEDGKWSIIDRNGELQSDYIYDNIEYFYNDLAEVRISTGEYDSVGVGIIEVGLMDKRGKIVLEPNKEYYAIYPLKDNYYFLDTTYYGVSEVDMVPKLSIIADSSGNVFFEPPEKEGNVYAEGEIALINYIGDDLFLSEYWSNGVRKQKVLDLDGNIVMDLGESELYDYHNGYYIVKEKNPEWKGDENDS